MREYQTSDCCGEDLKLTKDGAARCTKCGRLDKNTDKTCHGFDPRESNRPPRMEGFTRETSKIHDFLQKERGDQRIGQYLINAVRFAREERVETVMEHTNETREYAINQIIWNLEAPELLEILKDYQEEVE